MNFRKIKYSFKRRFFKLLSILIGIIILFVPFSASAVSGSFDFPPFHFTNISVYQLFSDASTPVLLNPSISYSSDDSSFLFRFNNPSSSNIQLKEGRNYIRFVFDLVRSSDSGSLYDLSFRCQITQNDSINFWYSGGGIDSSLSLVSDNLSLSGEVSLQNSYPIAYCSLSSIPTSSLSSAQLVLDLVYYSYNTDPFHVVFSDISFVGGYPAPDDSDINDFEDIENGLIEDTQSHFDNFFSSVTDFNGIIFNDLSFTFTAIKTYFDKFLDLPFVGKLPFVGLALGILPSLLGVVAVAGKKIL